NLGPAGGIARGMRHVLTHADDHDWIVLLDDDDPPEAPTLLADLLRLGEHLRAGGEPVGGVGLCAARCDTARARSVPVAAAGLAGPVGAGWVSGSHCPLSAVAAVRAVGVFDDRLFFGFDDLEYGLRLVGAGYRIYAPGDPWHRARVDAGRIGIDRSTCRA